MKSFSSDEIAQIKAILARQLAGKDWLRRKLRFWQKPEDVTYDDVFTVSDEDVYDYALANGFDTRITQEVTQLPPNPEPFMWYYVRPVDNRWAVSIYFDRGEYNDFDFSTLDEARRWVVRQLVRYQWYEYCQNWMRKHEPASKVPCHLRFPPPKNLRLEDLL